MKENIDDILKRNARHSGMTAPEGYFADFTRRMEASLPPIPAEEKPTAAARRVSLWSRMRPYAYMAAMFCGVWLMMWIFNDIAGRAVNVEQDEIASLVDSENFYDYYATQIDEYDLMEEMYSDGIDPVVLTDYR